jgi:hypothetical protein
VNTFNAISSAVFDVLLAPFGHGAAGFDLLFWPIVCGVIALIIYKYVSNQRGIERAKDQIKMHLLEVRLWRHELRTVFPAIGRILVKNAVYVGHNLAPMVVLIVPFLIVLVQLEANYAFAPSEPGTVQLLHVTLAEDAVVRPTEVRLALPEGVSLDAPPVRTPDGEVFWRLRADAPGDHVLTLQAGDAVLEKGWAVGGPPRKVPVKRTRDWEAFLYPGEAGIPAGSPFHAAVLRYPVRQLPWLPDGELGVLAWFFILSLVAGFALKDVFGVTL